MRFQSWLLLSFIAQSYAGTINCSAGGECQNIVVDCPNDNSDCTIVCAATGCKGSTINCLDGYKCTVITGGEEAAALAHINGNQATILDIFTGVNGDKQLEDANVTCPSSPAGHCYVNCLQGGYHLCHRLQLHGESANTLWIMCETNECCFDMDIWCPLDNTDATACVIDGQDFTTGITQLSVYSQHGFNSVTIYDGVTNQNNFGTMYCLHDYSSSCIIDTGVQKEASDQHNRCINYPQTCDNPPGTVHVIINYM